MDEAVWQELYRHVATPVLDGTVTGFNANSDQIIPVTRELLDSLIFQRPDLLELRSRLVHSMERCTAEEWFVADPIQYRGFVRLFSGTGLPAVGGQAGIAAEHLARLGASEVICVAPELGPDAAGRLRKAGVCVYLPVALQGSACDLPHLIFEYEPGLVPLREGIVPRSNRFIVSPVYPPASVLIPEGSLDLFLKRIASCTRAFLSGYQYLVSDEDFSQAAYQMNRIKNAGTGLRIHIECVTVTNPAVMQGFTRYILPVVDSIGLNEHEFSLLAGLFEPGMQPDREGLKTPAGFIEGALAICRKTGLKRLHLHTFGYYVLVIRKPSVDPEVSRNALLYASVQVAAAAQGTSSRISPVGLAALDLVADRFGPAQSPGIFLVEEFFVIVVPTLIASGITKTSGLGDILSSTAFVADRF
jgi:ADP-dependent phosphofructokinase/glucokinase